MVLGVPVLKHFRDMDRVEQPFLRKWSTQAMSFRPNPFHANYFLNVYNMSSMYLNEILFKLRPGAACAV